MRNIRGYSEDRSFSDLCMPAVKLILLECGLDCKIAREEDDKLRAMDLIHFEVTEDESSVKQRIAARIRRRKEYFYARFPDDFTLRVERASGARTEYDKIMAGWGKYFFYGHASDDGILVDPWRIYNLDNFRTHARKPTFKVPATKYNADGSTAFIPFNLSLFIGLPPIIHFDSNSSLGIRRPANSCWWCWRVFSKAQIKHSREATHFGHKFSYVFCDECIPRFESLGYIHGL